MAWVFGFVLAPVYYWPAFAGDIYGGYESMVEITLLSLLIGGLAALARASGGLQWLADAIAGFARGHTGRRAGEFSIAALAPLGEFFTANNNVAIPAGRGRAEQARAGTGKEWARRVDQGGSRRIKHKKTDTFHKQKI